MNEIIHTYYKISNEFSRFGSGADLSNTFLNKITRRGLLNNFIDVFGIDNMVVFADNANPEIIEFIKSKEIKDIRLSSIGYVGIWLHVVNSAIMSLKPDDIVYFVEDDYIHTLDAKQYIYEGLKIADYVTLYDSLDKYIDTDKGGNNPLIKGSGEDTKLVLGDTCHFKFTNSTTSTFACKIKTLQEDLPVILKHCRPEKVYEFMMFRDLINNYKRLISCPIPGKASHIGLELSPFVDWMSIVYGLKED
jgi:hypothetical protein